MIPDRIFESNTPIEDIKACLNAVLTEKDALVEKIRTMNGHIDALDGEQRMLRRLIYERTH